jgi:hypothetical protein
VLAGIGRSRPWTVLVGNVTIFSEGMGHGKCWQGLKYMDTGQCWQGMGHGKLWQGLEDTGNGHCRQGMEKC